MRNDLVEMKSRYYLRQAGGRTTPHSGRTLYEHLESVQKLLNDRGN